MTNQEKADRLATITKIAERQKREKATALRMAKLKARSKTFAKRAPKKKRDSVSYTHLTLPTTD